jgi:ribosomal protein S18 acetylase RimI-like enzyme
MATLFAPSTRDLVDLEELADQIGVFLDLHLDKDEDGEPFIWLGSIERTCGSAGAGREALRLIADYADENGLAIRAAVLCWNERLISYYSEQGFEVIEEAHPDSRHDHSIMQRAALEH